MLNCFHSLIHGHVSPSLIINNFVQILSNYVFQIITLMCFRFEYAVNSISQKEHIYKNVLIDHGSFVDLITILWIELQRCEHCHNYVLLTQASRHTKSPFDLPPVLLTQCYASAASLADKKPGLSGIVLCFLFVYCVPCQSICLPTATAGHG